MLNLPAQFFERREKRRDTHLLGARFWNPLMQISDPSRVQRAVLGGISYAHPQLARMRSAVLTGHW